MFNRNQLVDWVDMPSVEFRDSYRHLREAVADVWWYAAPGLSAFFLFMAVWVGQLSREPRGTGSDPAVFLYTGWLLTEGRLVYVHFWDIKPPLIHYLTGSIFLVAGGDPLTTHIITTAFGAAAMVGSIILVAVVVYQQTDDEIAAAAGAFSILLFTSYYTVATYGIRPKYLFVFFGLLAVVLLLEERHLWAGVAATLSMASYQLGGVFLLIVLWSSYREGEDLRRTTGAVAAVGFVLLAPFLIAGELWTLTRQVLLMPVLDGSSSETALERSVHIRELLPLGGLLVAFGAAAAVYEYIQDRASWWLLALIGCFIFSALFVDLNAAPDLIQLTAVAGIGFGIGVARLSAVTINSPQGTMHGHTAGLLLVVAAVYITTPSLGSLFLLSHNEVTPVGELYFDQKLVDRCHVRMSTNEVWWIETAGIDTSRSECHWPIRDLLPAIRS